MEVRATTAAIVSAAPKWRKTHTYRGAEIREEAPPSRNRTMSHHPQPRHSIPGISGKHALKKPREKVGSDVRSNIANIRSKTESGSARKRASAPKRNRLVDSGI
jgi:hypothetical protein